MVTTSFKGGMGNQMFQYAIGRIIAEAKGHKLEIANPDNRQELFNQFPFVNTAGVDGKEVRDNTMAIAHDLQHMDVDAAINHGGHVFLHGYWQKYHYYEKHRDKLRQWFSYDDSQHEKPKETDLVLHIRLGDQLRPEPIGLPETAETYVELLKKIPHERCVLISDAPDDPWIECVRKYPTVSVRKGSQMEDFTMLKYAKRAIISQSTFAWWATFLGEPTRVYAPLCVDGRRLWKLCPAVQDIDLIPLNNTYQIFKI